MHLHVLLQRILVCLFLDEHEFAVKLEQFCREVGAVLSQTRSERSWREKKINLDTEHTILILQHFE